MAWLSKKMVGFSKEALQLPEKKEENILTARFLPCLHTKAGGMEQWSIVAVDVFHLPHTSQCNFSATWWPHSEEMKAMADSMQ